MRGWPVPFGKASSPEPSPDPSNRPPRTARAAALPLLLALAFAALSGCTDFSDDAPEPSNRIGILGVDIAAPVVTAGSVTLEVRVTLDNLAARSGDLNLTVKAYDTASSMLVKTAKAPVGEMRKDVSKEVAIRLTLPRDAGYRIEVLLEQDGRLVQNAQVSASNLQALEPTEYDTGLRIDQIDVQVVDAKDGRAILRCPVYLMNEGGSSSRALRLQLKAREVSTGILADEEWADIDPIAADNTRAQHVTLEVPEGYNYELQAFLWDGEVIVERGLGKVQLLPTYTQPAGQQIVVTEPDIGQLRMDFSGSAAGYDYDGDGRVDYYSPNPRSGDDYDDESDGPTPGLALPLLVLALGGAAALTLRRKNA